MLYMIIQAKPVSLRARCPAHTALTARLRAASANLGWDALRLAGDLYARIVWFQGGAVGSNRADLDNVIKPVLDAFADDASPGGERRLFNDAQFVQCWVSRHDPSQPLEYIQRPAVPTEPEGELHRMLSLHSGDDILYIEFGEASATRIALGPPLGAVR